MPNAPVSTTLQQSIFNAPPSSAAAPIGLPPKPVESTANGMKAEEEAPHGVKRTRDESDDEDAPMEEDDDDDDVPMEASSDEEE